MKGKGRNLLILLGVLSVFAAGCAGGNLGCTVDDIAPVITAVNTANGATDVPINRKIKATFSEMMDSLTVDTTTFTLTKIYDVTPVPSKVTYAGFVATLAPTDNLVADTFYTATVTTGATDLAGNPLVAGSVLNPWTFRTGTETEPEVILVNPTDGATGVLLNRSVTATFSEAMNPATIESPATTFTLTGPGLTPVPGTVSYAGVMATFTPTGGNLTQNTTYTATITTAAQALATNNPLAADYVWTFRTGTLTDNIAPWVESTNPDTGATNVPINKAITATFSELMDPTTIDTTTFTLTDFNGTDVPGMVGYAGTIATFTPDDVLTVDTDYTAKILGGVSGVKDLANNGMATDTSWVFTTVATPEIPPPLNPVALGQAGHFATLAGYAVTNVPTSDITGDIGISPAAQSFITGFSQTDHTGYAISPQVTGFIYAADMAVPTPDMLTTAKGDLTIAYNNAKGRTPVPVGTFLNPGAGNLAGLNLGPGLYKFTGAAIATSGFTLDGGANDVWIFQIASNLNVSDGVQVTLGPLVQAKNIFWQVGTEATLGTYVTFYGTIMAEASITMKTGATLYGRMLAFSGTVALDQNTIVIPTS